MTAPACVGCGWCCLTDQCEVSHRAYGYLKRCPDLRWEEDQNRYLCMRMLDDAHGALDRQSLAEGEGCCNRFSTWRDDVCNRDDDR